MCTLFCIPETNAQTVVVQTNNGTTNSQKDPQNPNIKYINGIPSTQDVGGVETNINGGYPCEVLFKNYNTFTVTVNYEIERGDEIMSGSLVLPYGETKVVNTHTYSHFIKAIYTISRKLQ